MKVPVQVISGDMSRIIAASGTALWLPIDCGLYPLFATDPKDSLIININIVMFLQFVSDPPVSHVWMFFVNLFDFLCNLLIPFFVITGWILQPTVIGSSGKVQYVTEVLYRCCFFVR